MTRAAYYRASSDPHGPVHEPSRWRERTKCGRLLADLNPTQRDAFDVVCRRCEAAASATAGAS